MCKYLFSQSQPVKKMASSKLAKEIAIIGATAVAAATGYYVYKERSGSPPPSIPLPHTPPPLGELENGSSSEKKEDKFDKKIEESKLKPVREEKRKVSDSSVKQEKDDKTPRL